MSFDNENETSIRNRRDLHASGVTPFYMQPASSQPKICRTIRSKKGFLKNYCTVVALQGQWRQCMACMEVIGPWKLQTLAYLEKGLRTLSKTTIVFPHMQHHRHHPYPPSLARLPYILQTWSWFLHAWIKTYKLHRFWESVTHPWNDCVHQRRRCKCTRWRLVVVGGLWPTHHKFNCSLWHSLQCEPVLTPPHIMRSTVCFIQSCRVGISSEIVASRPTKDSIELGHHVEITMGQGRKVH